MANLEQVEALQAGGERARALHALYARARGGGLRRFESPACVWRSRLKRKAAKAAKASLPALQYREVDGQFYFKLQTSAGALLQSVGFSAPKDAAQAIAQLQQQGHPDCLGALLGACGRNFVATGVRRFTSAGPRPLMSRQYLTYRSHLAARDGQ
jgi:tryptophanyl-tRNA synthetase